MNPADEHRDPDVEAAWRAASREQPPPALDAAITAAARRAVGAGPKHLDAPRTWWPIAAAAVVAVVAIGIVEMTPPEEVAPTLMPAAPQPLAEPASQPPGRQDTMREQRAPAHAAGALASRSEPASSDKPQPLAKRARDDEVKKQKDAQPRTVDEWIGLIRRLKAQGRNDLVAKELTAFRARYGERADALLPADLRDTKP